MDRFVSNTINKLDKKGRVSIPASFRACLQGQSVLHVVLGIDHPVADAGGPEFMEANRSRLEKMDPFSQEYEYWSFCLIGDAHEIRIDAEGRIQLPDTLREHTGITTEVAFVGRGHFFQLWEPQAFRQYRETAREKVREMRRKLAGEKVSSPAEGKRTGEQA